jgi:methylmalonyl-CoA/ethylmalonyl-CoA epimerase
MGLRFHHMGIVVPSIERYVAANEALFQHLKRGEVIRNETQGVLELFIGDGAFLLEVLEPLGDSSPVRGLLSKNPRGALAHFCFETDDLDQTLADVEASGGRVVVSPVPDVAFGMRKIAFVFIAGQIIELLEHGDQQ